MTTASAIKRVSRCRWAFPRIPWVTVSLGMGVVPVAVDGQVVAGTVMERYGRTPVVGALVRLVAQGEVSESSYLTGADGRYRLTAPRGGAYHVMVERIGLASVPVGPVEVPAAGTVPFDVVVDVEPVGIGGLTVESGDRLCRSRPATALGVQALWDDIRKALAGARWTETEGVVRLRLRSYVRELAPRDRAVVSEEAWEQEGTGTNSVYSAPVEELDRDGWVRTGPDRELRYFAPDAGTLLSDTFLATQCFDLVEADDDRAPLQGLAFEPLPGRDLPDIQGVLWVDRASHRLDHLEFRHTGLPRGPGDQLAGGRVEFTELPDGRWIVSRWRIRMPVVGVVRSSTRWGTVDRRMVTAIRERGSSVLEARGESYRWSPGAPSLAVFGVVWDSTAAAPLAAAEVRLAGRGWVTRSDSVGRFSFQGIPEGTYRIGFRHPRLDSLGVEPAWRRVNVEAERPESSSGVRLAVPSRESTLALRCGQATPALVGRVVEADTESGVPGVRVETRDSIGVVGGTTTGPEGWYVICLPPGDGSMRLVARLGQLASATRTVRPPTEGPGRFDLVFPSVGETQPEGSRRRLTGRVVASDGLRPLEGALVSMVDDSGNVVDRALVDVEGRFVLEAARPGPHRVRAEHLGRAPVESELLDLGEGRPVEIRMPPEALPLEGVVVTVPARSALLEEVGFYKRERFFRGTFLPREVLESFVPARTSDILFRHTSARTFDMASATGDTQARWLQVRPRTGRDGCLPAIFIDGALARRGLRVTASGLPPDYLSLDDLVSPDDIEAMEVYETSIPVQYSAGGCGSVLVWRKRGGDGGPGTPEEARRRPHRPPAGLRSRPSRRWRRADEGRRSV